MRSIASRCRAASKLGSVFVLTVLAVCGSASPVSAVRHPKYGGKFRVEIRESTISLDPRTWKPGTPEAAANAQIAALVFDRLVSLDRYGRFQPQLAADWTHDATFRRWQFALRTGAKFSDGSALSPSDVEGALRPLLPAGLKVGASGNTIIVQSAFPVPDLLEILSSGAYFVYRALSNGSLIGTGPFVLTERSAVKSDPPRHGAHYIFQANEASWAGRPFVDSVEISAGVPALTRLLDLQLGRADLIELAPELVRRAQQESLRIWRSEPVTLYGLRVTDSRGGAEAAWREALSLAVDRATMAGVLLQKQAEPATALLPEWLSGYAFLFTVDTNLERARELRAALPKSAAAAVALRVDAPGELANLVSERVAVNARQAGINVQVTPRTQRTSANSPNSSGTGASDTGSSEPASIHLFAWRTQSLSPRMELQQMSSALHLGVSGDVLPPDDLQTLYGIEKALMEEHKIIPLVVIPDYAALSPNVRDWMPSAWGEWHLADVWLDQPESTAMGAKP
jgi:ABC-type transport system substrate-binding protein